MTNTTKVIRTGVKSASKASVVDFKDIHALNSPIEEPVDNVKFNELVQQTGLALKQQREIPVEPDEIANLKARIVELEQELKESLRPIRTKPTDRKVFTHRFILKNISFQGCTHWMEEDYEDPKNKTTIEVNHPRTRGPYHGI